jgi:DNA-binding NtrC family response regulator
MKPVEFSLYLIDDEQSIRNAVVAGLKRLHPIKAFASAEDALKEIAADRPDLVLLDIGLPGMSGLEALREIKRLHPDGLVVMITAFDKIDTVVAAMQAGAYDYVVKPLRLDPLKVTVGNALESIRLRKEIQLLQEQYLTENVPCFIGDSNVIHDVMDFVGKVAKSTDTPILIAGETGTGKELIARAIHYKSPNFAGPFVSINCAAIPKDLIESELFGYEKGAFSGAGLSGKKGLVEEAAGGTLFLDEVGDLSGPAQAKLLRFLEDGEFYRVGGVQKMTVQARIVSATNKDLDRLIGQELFREDLYFRLAVVRVELPTLTQRRDDIVPIARHFLLELGRRHGRTFTGIAPKAERFLEGYNYRGNVRELRNIIERGVLIGSGPVLELEDLDLPRRAAATAQEPQSGTPAPGAFPELPDAGIDFDALEKHYVRQAYEKAGGNEIKAAQLLGMTYYSYRYKRKKLNIV